MIPLRLVLDTNIVVSAAIKPESIPHTVLVLALTKPVRLFVSEPVLEEYAAVLARRELGIRKGLRMQFLQMIRNRSRCVSPVRPITVTRDPHDNKFLECADAARADYLVTGNLRHFPTYWKRTKIIPARDLLELVAPHLLG